MSQPHQREPVRSIELLYVTRPATASAPTLPADYS
jgi:hypothetical protein